MILLDTNVISEPLRVAANSKVLAWINAQIIETLYVSTISLAELRYGIAVLPEGKRRDALHNGLEDRVLPHFAGRILSFDTAASSTYATLRARARANGHTIAPADGYVAGIAAAHGLIVATRDVAPFLAVGLKIINPWETE